MRYLTGGAAAGTVPATISSLAEGALRALFLARLKVAGVLLLLASLLATGVGLAVHEAVAARLPEPRKGEAAAPAARATNPAQVEGEKQAHTDRYGDALPDAAVARLGTIRFNHPDGLNSLLFSPDGKTIISEGHGHICLWDAATGKPLRQFSRSKPSFVDQAALSPDGNTMTILHQDLEDTVYICDLTEGKEARAVTLPVLRTSNGVYRRNALSRDGRLGAVHTPEQIRVFEMATAKELYALPKEGEEYRAVIFAGNDLLVTADQERVIGVWEAQTGKPVRQFAHGDPVEVLAPSADGCRLATLEHAAPLDRLPDRNVVHIWNLTTGTRERTLAVGPKRRVFNVRLAPDGKRLFTSSYGEDGTSLTVWDVETGRQVRQLAGAGGRVLAVSPNGSQLADGQDGNYNLWDVSSGRRLSYEDSRHAMAATVLLSPAGERAITVGYGTISTWDATTGQRLQSFDLPPYIYPAIQRSVSPDGRYAVSYTGDFEEVQILIWDIAARQRLHTLRHPGATHILMSAFSPDSSLLATWQQAKESAIRIWDVRTGREIRSFKETKANDWPPRVLDFTAAGDILFAASGRRVAAFDVASGRDLFSWSLQEKAGWGWHNLAVSPDGKRAACILADSGRQRAKNRILLCEAPTGKVLRRWDDSHKPSKRIEQLRFSPDSRLLVSSDGAVIHVWEAATGKEVRTFRGHTGEVRYLAFSANGRRLASASTDSTVLLWDLTTSEPRARSLPKEFAEQDLAAWWDDLSSQDAGRAYAAIWRMSEVPSASIAFLRQRLRPVTDAQITEIRQHINDLNSDTFGVREKSFRLLENLGPIAATTLQSAAERNATPEVRRRIEQLLENLVQGPVPSEPLRIMRALAVLEHAATPDARRLLQALADGAAGAWLTQEAKAVVDRLATRPPFTP
jgi:WD40 repeat protein